MIQGLQAFLGELRSHDLGASPAEWLDAMRAIEIVGVADRERFRHALAATLVKRARQQAIFDHLFDRFFATPRGRRRQKGRRAGSGPAPAAQPVHGRRRRIITAAERPAAVARDLHRPGDPARTLLKHRLTAEQERELAALIPRMIERIRLRQGRRLKRSARGKLYLRRVFRENLSTDGVPFVLPRRRRCPRRPRVVLLIDVSWSVARAAGLFLTLAFEFLERLPDTRVLFFIDRAIDVTPEFRRWWRGQGVDAPQGRSTPRPGNGIMRGGRSFAALLEALPDLNLDAPSDYGRAFDSVVHSVHLPGGRDRVWLVLGDGRSNRFDPQAWILEDISARCGALLWLVPESRAQWGRGDSALDRYLPHVDTVVEARDLDGLARGVGELLRGLGR